MKLTLSWLKDHLDTDASLEAICERLTMIGLEVENSGGRAVFMFYGDFKAVCRLDV